MIKRIFTPLFLFILAWIFIPVSAFSQSTDWKKELPKFPSKLQKAEYLLQLAEKFEYDKGTEEIVETAYAFAKESNTDSTFAKATFAFGKYYQLNGNPQKALTYLQSAKILFLKQRLFNKVLSVLYWQGKILTQLNLPDSLIHIVDKNQLVIQLANDEKSKTYIYLIYGNAYLILNQKDSALSAYSRVLSSTETQKDTDLYVAVCMNIAQLQSSFDSSMIWYNKVLPLTRVYNRDMYARMLTAIGWEYSQRDDAKRDSALYYFREAEKYISYMETPMSKLMLCNYMGDFLVAKNESRRAIPYFMRAIQYSKEMGIEQPLLLSNLGIAYVSLHQLDSAAYYLNSYKKAIEGSTDDYQLLLYHQLTAMYGKAKGDSCTLDVLQHYNQTISYSVKLNNTRHGVDMIVNDVMNCLLDKSRQTNETRKIAKSILGHCQYFYNAIKSENKLVSFSGFLEKYAALEGLYGNKDTALVLYKELADIFQEIQHKKYLKGLDEAMVKYQSELKDADIQLLTQKQQTSKIKINLVLVCLAAVLLISALVFMLYRRENRSKQQLNERNHKVEELLREVHHRVKNNLQIVSSFINIQLDKVVDKEATQALKDTSTRIMALAGLHNSLYRQDDLSKIQLDEYIKELCQSIGSSIQNHYIEIDCDLESLQLDMDKAISIGLALNELITNAIKHAFEDKKEGAKILVSLHHKEQWELIVKDNGKGIPEDFGSKQTQSIGIRLVQNLIQRQVKGNFTYQNENGALFKIEFMPQAAA